MFHLVAGVLQQSLTSKAYERRSVNVTKVNDTHDLKDFFASAMPEIVIHGSGCFNFTDPVLIISLVCFDKKHILGI